MTPSLAREVTGSSRRGRGEGYAISSISAKTAAGKPWRLPHGVSPSVHKVIKADDAQIELAYFRLNVPAGEHLQFLSPPAVDVRIIGWVDHNLGDAIAAVDKFAEGITEPHNCSHGPLISGAEPAQQQHKQVAWRQTWAVIRLADFLKPYSRARCAAVRKMPGRQWA